MRIAIVGTGAVGGYYGAMLARSGQDVHFLMRRDYAKVKANGLCVRSCLGNFHLDSVSCYNNPHDIGPVDLAFISIKATDNDQLSELVTPLMARHTRALTVQNGLGNEEILANIVAAENVAGGLAFLCSNRLDDGTIHHLDYGHIHIGNYRRPPDKTLNTFGQMLNDCGVKCEVVENLALSRWKKLIWNVPFNGLTTLTDQTVDKIVGNPELRQWARGLMLELQAAAASYDLYIENSFLDLMMEYTDKMEPYYTSMHLDARCGRKLEIEPIIGQPLRYAEKHNMAVPCLSRLYHKLKEKYSYGNL